MKLCLLCSARYDDDVKVCANDGARLVAAGQDNLINSVVGEKYYIDELIGKGSLGRVYRAHRISDDSLVAIKVLRENLSNDEEALTRFKREAQMLSIIEHPNIVALHDFGQTSAGEPYFAAEYLDGKTLATVISEQRCLTVSEAEPIFEQVCAGLAEAHSHGFIHRDIKPTNIILLQRGGDLVAKILDFSLAKLPPLAIDDKATKEGMLRGTPAYMSPEQCQSMAVDNRSDIYSLAVVLFETLTGIRPFSSKNSVITMHQQMNEVPPRMMSLRTDLYFCQELEELIQQCLAKKPGSRPESVEEFLQKFREACEAQRNVAKMETPPVYYTEVADSAAQLSPLEKFREADERRIVLEKLLAAPQESEVVTADIKPVVLKAGDDATETIKMTTEELAAHHKMASEKFKPEADAPQSDFGTSKPHGAMEIFAALMANERSRKVILGIVLVVLLIIGLAILLTVQIPNPEPQ